MLSDDQIAILLQLAMGRRLRVHLSSATWQHTKQQPHPDDLSALWPEYFTIVPGADDPPQCPFGWATLTDAGQAGIA